MLATRISGITEIINASLEPEVMDVIEVLKKMGACIQIEAPATIRIEGVTELNPIEHSIMPDRLEAGSLLIAIAATGGHIYLPNVDRPLLDVFLLKLEEMGHSITTDGNGKGIRLRATKTPCAVSFKTAPFPGFPTDLQSPMMALQCTAEGKSIIEETVFENRFMHVPYLQKMGAKIEVHGNKAVITGVVELHGTSVVATDIRASMALVVAGLMAQGTTSISKIHHWRRGYDGLENKLHSLGAHINLQDSSTTKNCPIIL
jgi:UDP-N-acetylglucosamine 1-carboxyvinyltransferase